MTEYYYSFAGTGNYSWLEIYNPTNTEINLSGYYLQRLRSGTRTTLDLNDLAKKESNGSYTYIQSMYPVATTGNNIIPAGKCIVIGANLSSWTNEMISNQPYRMFILKSTYDVVNGEAWDAHLLVKAASLNDANAGTGTIIDNLGWENQSSYVYFDPNSFYRKKDSFLGRPKFDIRTADWYRDGYWLRRDYLGTRYYPFEDPSLYVNW